MESQTSDVCCPKFDPAPWEGKTHEWKDKLFVKKTLPQIFHIPLPGTIGKMMEFEWPRIQKAGAAPEAKDFLWITYDPSPWKSEHYLAVTHPVPGMENVTLSGTFISKVFDGPYQAVPQWIKAMDRYLAEVGKKAQKYYFYFTTCPKCAKKYGHNYTVTFAQVT